ncbi:MAG: helix-turn-helix transcriptional regulator [Pseudomonadales bacterium]
MQPDSRSLRWNIYRLRPAHQSPSPSSLFRCLTRKPTRHCRSFRSEAPFPRTIRRQELKQIIPLSETTIYEMERRGELPRRFNLTPRCVVWDLAEIEAWIEERKQAPRRDISGPDVRLRKTRPVRASSDQV